jgi:hypothetical protein
MIKITTRKVAIGITLALVVIGVVVVAVALPETVPVILAGSAICATLAAEETIKYFVTKAWGKWSKRKKKKKDSRPKKNDNHHHKEMHHHEETVEFPDGLIFSVVDDTASECGGVEYAASTTNSDKNPMPKLRP